MHVYYIAFYIRIYIAEKYIFYIHRGKPQKDFTKPRQTLQSPRKTIESPSRLYKAPERLEKPSKRLYKALEY